MATAGFLFILRGTRGYQYQDNASIFTIGQTALVRLHEDAFNPRI